MLLYTPRIAPNSKADLHEPDLKSQSSTDAVSPVSTSWVPKWARFDLSGLRIGQKIGYGYVLAIGIAILGTGAGLLTGDYYRRQALQQLEVAREQEQRLAQLQMTVLEARSHASRLPATIGNSVWLSYESSRFFKNLTLAENLVSEIESFVNLHPHQLAADKEKFKDLLKTYAINLNYYGEITKSLLKQVNPSNLKPEEMESAQQQILRGSGEEAIVLDRLSDRLKQLISAASAQEQLAAVALQHAEVLRFRIIVASMLLSACVAAAMAVYTSRAIARPLESVTKVAQQAAVESNFQLQAPITTNDEVGVLATSLNQLIQRVADYTQELKQAQIQMIQTEKMSSLGQMVAGVAHEINNPINFIYGNLNYANDYIQNLIALVNLYQQQYPQPTPAIENQIEVIELDFLSEDLPKLLSSMKVGVDRIRQIVLSLRNFSRLDEAERKPVNINEGIDSTLLILDHRLKQGIEVIKQYGDLPLVECYPAQLNQVFMNILSNAIDALELARDKRQLASGSLPPAIWIFTKIIGDRWLQVQIVDNGPGMTPEIKNKIFDPFFTTKDVGKGTGLGLAICYQIVEKHQGKIEVFSEPGQGTKFFITLPAT